MHVFCAVMASHECHLALQALLLAVRLWSIMPADVRQKCLLLPDGCNPPPAAFFHAATNAEVSGAPEAAAAFFTPQHVRTLLPVLRAASGAHPRLHSLWPSLLALLLPGFTADKVRPTHESNRVISTGCKNYREEHCVRAPGAYTSDDKDLAADALCARWVPQG